MLQALGIHVGGLRPLVLEGFFCWGLRVEYAGLGFSGLETLSLCLKLAKNWGSFVSQGGSKWHEGPLQGGLAHGISRTCDSVVLLIMYATCCSNIQVSVTCSKLFSNPLGGKKNIYIYIHTFLG